MNISLKKLTSLLVAVVLVVGAVVACQSINKDEVNAAAEEQKAEANIVTVNGKGIVSAEPNIAYINVAVKTLNKNIKKAQTENAKQMDNVMKELMALGIDKKDIQTQNYSVDEDYDWINDREVFKGYEIRNSITIKVRDLTKAGDVLDKSISAGANVANGIHFDLENRDELYNEALKLAMKSADSKAGAIMETFGAKVSKPYRVVEQNTSYRTEYAPMYNAKMMADEEDIGGRTSIQAGSLKVIANVEVEYAY